MTAAARRVICENGKTCLIAVELTEARRALDDRLDDLKELLTSRLTSIEDATGLAREQMDQRLLGMNEFREQLRDQASRLITRAEMTAMVDPVRELLSSLDRSRSESTGKASVSSVVVTGLMGMAGLILGVVQLLIRYRW